MPASARIYETMISVFIAGVLLLQAGTMVNSGTRLGHPATWPIVSYLMYDDPHYDGETIQAYYMLEGTLRDGSVVQIEKEDLGLNFWNYLYLGDGLAQDPPSDVDTLLKLYKKSDQLVELRVKTLPLMITRTGQAYKPSAVVRTIPLGATAHEQTFESTPPSRSQASP